MSPSDISLDIRARDAATEIFVIDGDLRLVDRGIGHLVTKPLPPGIYKVKSRAGIEMREEHVVLREPGQIVTLPPFSFASPAPLDGTSRTHEYHVGNAEAHSRRVHASVGKGSLLFVFAREWTTPRDPVVRRSQNPAAYLSLSDMNGLHLVDIEATSARDNQVPDPWAACNIELAPGLYRLVLTVAGDRLSLTIVTSPGWQTQVFLPMCHKSEGRCADLASASILMARMGHGFNSRDSDLRLAELARLALTNQRRSVSEDLRQMLIGKFDNPMLGIYAGHLLRLPNRHATDPASGASDADLLRTVVANTRAVLNAPHPDVEALALAANLPTSYVFTHMPMMRRSWAIVVDRTVTQPQLVPATSQAAAEAPHVCQVEPWLLVETPALASGADADEEPEAMATAIAAQLAAPRQAGRTDSPFAAVRKRRAARTLASANMASVASQAFASAADAAVPPETAPDDRQIARLVATLRIPRASVEQMLTTRRRSTMSEQSSAANEDKWCFAWPEARKSVSGKDKAALVKAARWNSGDVITISFLDGDPTVQERVRNAAMGWTAPGMANLTFDFRKNTNETLIRISFRYRGSWSVIGTTCRQITDKTRPTMNYGWLTPQSTDAEVRRVVLHEFGHALGLIHEHQHPVNGIHWNRDAVIRELSGPPNNWPLDVIEHNMFEPYSADETNFSQVDPQSIMMYPIPKSWTTDGFSVGLNTGLSATDKTFIRQQYP